MFKTDPDNKIEYPCNWIYKVIGENFKTVNAAIAEVLTDRKYKSNKSNMSSKGTYISIKVELVVENEDIRDNIFHSLRKHDDIKMVL
ncbi:MAG: DUF493 domain-containing protein [Calditrichae bacterium]|nr:DUF493 domain-containing protein [Calditrichia bacterium]